VFAKRKFWGDFVVKPSTFIMLVPLFNEETRVDLERFESFQNETKIKIIFVDDGSTDKTYDHLCNHFIGNADVHVLKKDKNYGKAEALRSGFLFALDLNPDWYILTFDADWSMSEDTVINLMRRSLVLEDKHSGSHQAVTVFSSARIYLAGMDVDRPVSRKWMGRIIATIVSIGIGITFYDPQTPLKIYKFSENTRSVFQKKMRTRWFFEGELFLRLRSFGKTCEVFEYPATNYLDLNSPNYRGLLKLRVLKDFIVFFLLVIRNRVRIVL